MERDKLNRFLTEYAKALIQDSEETLEKAMSELHRNNEEEKTAIRKNTIIGLLAIVIVCLIAGAMLILQ